MDSDQSGFMRLLTIAVQTGWIVVIILGLFVIAWVVLRWLAKRWRQEAEALAKQLSQDLHELDVTRQALREEAARYPPSAPPPYQTTARLLQQALATISGTTERLHAQHAALDAQKPAQPERPLAKLRFALRQEPRFWHRRRERLASLVDEAQALHNGEVTEAQGYLKDLRAKPLETAEKVRALHQALTTARDTARALRSSGLYGETFHSVVSTLETCASEIGALPPYLLDDAGGQILRHADPADIGQAWQTISGLAATAGPALDKIEVWQATHAALVDDLATMHHAVDAAVQALREAPATLDLEALGASDRALRVRAQTLSTRYVAFTVEDLEAREMVHQTIEDAEGLSAQLATLQTQHTTLSEALDRNAERLDQIEAQLRALTQATRYPLDRVPLQAALDQLVRQAAAISNQATSLTPDQLEAQLAEAQTLDQQIQTLAANLTQAREARRKLIGLMERATERSPVDWLAWAEDVDGHTHGYAPENWDEALDVPSVLTDAQVLAERRARWLPDRPDAPLDPDTLAQRVDEVTDILGAVEACQDRLGQITTALQDLQSVEAAAIADRDAVYAALARLDETAGATLHPDLAQEKNHWHALREHMAVGDDLARALAAPARSTVAAKADEVDAWIQASDKTLASWQRALYREHNDAHTTLARAWDELRAVAPLDEEPAMQRAREAIDQAKPGAKPARRRGHADRETITATCRQIEQTLQALTRLDQASDDLRAPLFTQLNDAVAAWQTAQREARDAFEGLKRLEADSARRWPPVSCGLETVAAQMALADEARDRLQRDGDTARHATQLLTEMIQHAQRIVALVERREAAYETLRPELDAILNDLDIWWAALEGYRDRHPDDPALAAAVRARLDEIEAAGTELQVRFEQAGLISGDEAQRALEHLWQQAHRDLPVGAGLDVIPVEAIERGR